MNRKLIFVWIMCVVLVAVCSGAFADYVMMCTFFQNSEARAYKLTDDGEIIPDYYLNVEAYDPIAIAFAPNGKWGLVGGTTGYPERYKTYVLGIDKERRISLLGWVYNDRGWLVAISPDSRYGVHGADLRSLRFHPNGTFTDIPTTNPALANHDAAFSKFNNYLYARSYPGIISEYQVLPDGRIGGTGFSINIEPATGTGDVELTPDGRTCIALSMDPYNVTSMQVHKEGGLTLVQQFNVINYNIEQIDFTPDSQYAVISFWDSREVGDLVSFRIGPDSRLTKVDSLDLPGSPGGNIAITPDGEYIIAIELYYYYSLFYVARLHEDGTMEYLPENDYICVGHVSDMAFVPPRITAAEGVWSMYE